MPDTINISICAYSDLGHIIENIVFLELIRRKYEVYIGFIQDGEIDFAAFKNGNIYSKLYLYMLV